MPISALTILLRAKHLCGAGIGGGISPASWGKRLRSHTGKERAVRQEHARAIIIAACGKAWARRMLSGFNGNMSLRAGERCFITRAGVAKGCLRPEDVTTARLDGTASGLAGPSSELGMHLALYRARPDALAVVHVHPPYLLALSLCVGEEDFLRLPLYEAERLRGCLRPVPAFLPGSEELARAAAACAAEPGVSALWLKRHGLVCFGGRLFDALALAEELEHLAAVQLAARAFTLDPP